MRLDPAAVAAGFRLVAYDVVTSTNADALELARSGGSDATWLTAREQTAGRGRRGAAWVSAPGNLYATMLLHDPSPAENAPELAFVAGLAVHDAIVGCDANLRQRLALKWPNDVLYDGSKLAGILIEGEHVQGRLAVAVGIGVNCAYHPAATAYPATDLAAAGAAISAETLFTALSATMLGRLAQWRRGAGFAAIRSAWLDRATNIGAQVRVRLPDRELTGLAKSLDAHGHLILRLADGSEETIAAGEVFPVIGQSAPAAQKV